jgi:hypothetical protein
MHSNGNRAELFDEPISLGERLTRAKDREQKDKARVAESRLHGTISSMPDPRQELGAGPE